MIAILAILMVMTVPSMGSLLDTNNVTRAGQMINDQIAMARQLASTRGQSVQVRFYKPDGKVNADASFFLLRASGAVEPDLGTNNDITVANTRRNPPVNYATIQVDPDSARTSIYRP